MGFYLKRITHCTSDPRRLTHLVSFRVKLFRTRYRERFGILVPCPSRILFRGHQRRLPEHDSERFFFSIPTFCYSRRMTPNTERSCLISSCRADREVETRSCRRIQKRQIRPTAPPVVCPTTDSSPLFITCSFCFKKWTPSCKPGSVFVMNHGGYHSSGMSITAQLKPPTRKLRTKLSRWFPIPSLCDVASDRVCRAAFVTEGAVGSYSTVSPLPLSRRFVFCGTVRHTIFTNDVPGR